MNQNPDGLIALSGFDKSWDGAPLMFTRDAPAEVRAQSLTRTST